MNACIHMRRSKIMLHRSTSSRQAMALLRRGRTPMAPSLSVHPRRYTRYTRGIRLLWDIADRTAVLIRRCWSICWTKVQPAYYYYRTKRRKKTSIVKTWNPIPSWPTGLTRGRCCLSACGCTGWCVRSEHPIALCCYTKWMLCIFSGEFWCAPAQQALARRCTTQASCHG